jgi:hypothetical protein
MKRRTPMLLTIDIAKNKLCPFAGLTALISKTLPDEREWHCCQGPDCMMWRTSEEYDDEVGYCGLAGKPE